MMKTQKIKSTEPDYQYCLLALFNSVKHLLLLKLKAIWLCGRGLGRENGVSVSCGGSPTKLYATNSCLMLGFTMGGESSSRLR